MLDEKVSLFENRITFAIVTSIQTDSISLFLALKYVFRYMELFLFLSISLLGTFAFTLAAFEMSTLYSTHTLATTLSRAMRALSSKSNT